MTSRLTPRQEKFARVYVETGNASEAYRQAYPRSQKWKPESVYAKASSLHATDKVRERVKELQAAAVARHEITVDGQITKLETIFENHKDNPKGAGAAVSAVKEQNAMMGLVTKKHEVTASVAVAVAQLPPLSPDAAEAILDRLLEDL